MNSTKELNVKLLRRVKRHILAEPRRLYMAWFSIKGKPNQLFQSDNGHSQRFAACGTAACIAGWACILGGKGDPNKIQYPVLTAERLLGIKWSCSLFLSWCWPNPFCEQYGVAKTSRQRAKIAAARIEHLIKTGE